MVRPRSRAESGARAPGARDIGTTAGRGDRRRGARPWRGAWRLLAVVAAVVTAATLARAEWIVGVSVEEGLSFLGGPLSYRMARPDGVTGASIDAVTSASHPASSGGVNVSLRRPGTGALVLGVEYVHYRFDLDWEHGRAAMDVVALRVPLLARLTLVPYRGRPFVTFGFGGYLEVALYDRGLLVGDQVGVEVAPLGAGLVVELRAEPVHSTHRWGTLIPALVLRGQRGLAAQVRDDLGSRAPLSSATLGVALRYEPPSRPPAHGSGRSGR
jgi:hypothetical protein